MVHRCRYPGRARADPGWRGGRAGLTGHAARQWPTLAATAGARAMRRDFRVGPEHGAEGQDQDGEGDAAVPAGPGAALQVVQSQAVPDLAVAVPDPPSPERSYRDKTV